MTIRNLALIVLCVAPTLPIMTHFSARVFPWWSDGGIWLKEVNAIFGRAYPMWNTKPLQFDYVFLLVLAGFKLILQSDLLALKASAVIIYALCPASAFVLARKVFKSDLAGLGAAMLSGFHPLLYETLGWGGYPNLLGYAILPLVIHSILTCIEKASRRNVGYASLMIVVTAFTHNLTAMVFLAVLGLWFLLAAVSLSIPNLRMARRQLLTAAYCLSVMIAAVAFQFFIVGMPEYDMANQAAFYKLRIGFMDLLWALKNSNVIFLLVILTCVSFIIVQFIRPESYEAYNLCMASWILAPLLLSQVYLLGITLDYRRVFLFAFQPTFVLVAGPFAFVSGLIPKLRDLGGLLQRAQVRRLTRELVKSLPAIVLILLSFSLLATEVGIGASYASVVNDWYNHIDLYGDKEKLQALEWIQHNTPESAVFVAEEPFARWIEGVASRRVLMYAPPQYLFVKGEGDRSIAAGTLLECRIELRSDLIRICDQAPYGNFTPSVSFKREGVYENILYFNNIESEVYVSNGTAEWSERLSEAATSRSHSLSSDLNSASYVASYSMDEISYEREITLEADAAESSLTYSVKTTGPGLKLLNFTISLFSAEGRRFDEVLAESTEDLRIRSGAQWFHVSLRGQVLGAILIHSQATDTILLSFKPRLGYAESISAHISFSPEAQGTLSGKLLAVNRDDIVREFMISYVAIPRVSRPRPNGVIPLKLESLPVYNHLLGDPAMRVVYENSNVIILRVVSS
jgi:hypothetical protein